MAITAKNQDLRADTQFKISQLRQDKMIYALEAIMVSIVGLMTSVFLPELILRIAIMVNPKLMDPPAFLTYVPHVTYALVVLFCVWVAAGNILRLKMIKQLELQLENRSYK